jgi:hypothetical protein
MALCKCGFLSNSPIASVFYFPHRIFHYLKFIYFHFYPHQQVNLNQAGTFLALRNICERKGKRKEGHRREEKGRKGKGQEGEVKRERIKKKAERKKF